jgi:hypothetical protein
MRIFTSARQKSHEALGKCFSKMDMEGAEDVAAAHQELAKTHADAAADSIQCCKRLDTSNKAMMGIADDGDGRFEKIVPDEVRGIITQYPGVTAVPRTGSPSIEKATNVPLEFAHLVKVQEE